MINQYQPWFEYAGTNSQEVGAYITSTNTYDTAEKNILSQLVAGRSGDLIIDNGNYKNININYTIAIPKSPSRINFTNATQILTNRFSAISGYNKLIDSYNPTVYRLASYNGATAFTVENNILSGTFSFNCKPFRYAFDGEKIITLTEPKTIVNTSIIMSLPYIKIYGSGDIDLYIENEHFLIKDVENEIEIDSEKMLVYKLNSGVFASQTIKYYSSDFPKLKHGENLISWSGNVSKVEIKPRWCML